MIAKSEDESQNQFHSFKLATLCFIVVLVLYLLFLLQIYSQRIRIPLDHQFAWLLVIYVTSLFLLQHKPEVDRKYIENAV